MSMLSRHVRGTRNVILAALLMFLLSATAIAQVQSEDGKPNFTPRWAFGTEYLSPTKNDRDLNTTNIDLLYHWSKPNVTLNKANLTLFLGLTVTRVTGTITQLTGSFEDGTLQETTYESSGNGIGPVFLLRYNAVRRGKGTFCLDVSHGIVFYDRSFPAGGDRYNGMRRLGPSFTYALSDTYRINLGYRWMHVSNGKGVVPHNPAYEARGAHLQIQLSY